MNLIQTAEHAYAVSAQEMVNLWRFVKHHALPALREVDANAAIIETITGLVNPQAENVERAAFAVLGQVIRAIELLPDSNGKVTVQVEGDVLAQLKEIAATVKNQIHPVKEVPVRK